MNQNNIPLAKSLRTQLENTVKAARDVAEKGAQAALSQLAVGEARAPDYLTEELKALRRRMRAHGRALGDVKAADDTQAVQHLVWEIAYEHWHRMLFARFLAENGLLLWEPGAAVSLDDCEALVQETDPTMSLGAKTKWELAGKLAARMLPQVFKPQSPVFELTFAPEHQRELERLLAVLPPEVFKASDSLGWVYQFWQAKRKDEVNASEVKIGADELPAVTQLFTEPYMVDFLLHNSLGAWWVTRHPGKPCPVPLTYLRTLDDGTPAAGKFEGWPDRLNEFKLLDPCCGSGHFLVAAFLMLVPMRMAAEGLTAMDAVDYVLQENLHGLELDARCVEIAVFALALAAWRFPDENGNPLGVRADMPAPQVACCGLKVAAKPEDWMAMVPDDAANAAYLRQELRLLHASFAQAPLLGSLLDPARSLKNDLAMPSFDTLRELLERALAVERPVTLWEQGSELQDDSWDLALTAKGLLDAGRLLGGRYQLVVTNVPYLSRGKQSDLLKDYCESHYPEAKNDLANVFLERCLELCLEKGAGVVQIVMPQNWLFLTSYRRQRESLLARVRFSLLALLGVKGFQTPMWDFNVQLLTVETSCPGDCRLRGVDVSSYQDADSKSEAILSAPIKELPQLELTSSPDCRITLERLDNSSLLGEYALTGTGLQTFDRPRFIGCFWERPAFDGAWISLQSTPKGQRFSGMSESLRWEGGCGQLLQLMEDKERYEGYKSGIWKAGSQFWGRCGVIHGVMANLPAAYYLGGAYDTNAAVLLPKSDALMGALMAYSFSGDFAKEVRKLDSKLMVTNATFLKVPFDVERWCTAAVSLGASTKVDVDCDDPTQWVFHGAPTINGSDSLQVAVARLLGFVWPIDSGFVQSWSSRAKHLADSLRCLSEYVDDDGIVCLPSVRGEAPAHDRLLKLLIAAWETVQPGSWKPAVLDKLLADADCAGKGLDVWLRDKFFEQHAKRFHHRPFIWHVWDGLKDGFAALVNYHKLDTKNLERLIHTYLGDWIRQQEEGVRNGVDGAEGRLSAAQSLKQRLELILEGEAPYDIFVRWKPLAEQPIGWNPDLNDGVRLNIRPFMKAEVLRHNKKPKLNISWDKDRGKDVESAPWFHKFQGDRINDHHLTIVEKVAAKGVS